MAKYLLEDTYNGFRITLIGSKGEKRHHFDEATSHGPICDLWAKADRLWPQLCAREMRDKWGDETARVLSSVGHVDNRPSNVSESPHRYLYVYPSWPEENPCFLVSEAAEYGEEGILVSRWYEEDYELPTDGPLKFLTLGAVKIWINQQTAKEN